MPCETCERVRVLLRAQQERLYGALVCSRCNCANSHAPGCIVGRLLLALGEPSREGRVPPLPLD